MSGTISNEHTHLLSRRYPNYGPPPPAPTLPELIQRCKERLEKLEFREGATADQVENLIRNRLQNKMSWSMGLAMLF